MSTQAGGVGTQAGGVGTQAGGVGTQAGGVGTRVAVVTGANRGIGRAITVALAVDGFAVAASARDPQSLADTVAEAGKAGGTAGVAGPPLPLHEITLDGWRDTLATDLDGVFLTFRAFIPAMIERLGGSLIAISSMTGKRPLHGRTPYAAAKMGVIGLVRTLATELGPYGIRVNAVCPGFVAGPRIEQVVRNQAAIRGITEEQARTTLPEASPLGRVVEAGEVARACAFLASDDSAAVTGEDLNVTAGVVMY